MFWVTGVARGLRSTVAREIIFMFNVLKHCWIFVSAWNWLKFWIFGKTGALEKKASIAIWWPVSILKSVTWSDYEFILTKNSSWNVKRHDSMLESSSWMLFCNNLNIKIFGKEIVFAVASISSDFWHNHDYSAHRTIQIRPQAD